ncbi:MAG TPA: SDR family oxidoreductase [Novosphingobium sp.]|nr:SDR family oxidoreductase [Novosphingobium sp.]
MSNSPEQSWPVALVTGAGGGMGQVIAARLADRYALALSEFREEPLAQLVNMLAAQGVNPAATATGDLGSPQVLEPLMASCKGRLKAVVHTAGHSPQTGTWRQILDINLVTTAKLLDAIEAQMEPGLAVVLIASMGRLVSPPAEGALGEVLENPLAPDFLDRMEPFLGDEAQKPYSAYSITKMWVAREVNRRAISWGPRGARIMSISPGMIYTRMGTSAVAEAGADVLLEQTPVRRWGTPMDIANVAEFILSDKASFLTGSDILVDGGTGQLIQALKG